MTQLRRLVAISILTVSLSGVALADGGDTQTPPQAPSPPPAECTTDCSGAAPSTPAPDSTVDIVATAEMLAVWLVTSIL